MSPAASSKQSRWPHMSSPAQTALEAARLAADVLLALVPAPVAQQLINDAEVKRANAIANLAEDAKFGPEKP